MIKSTMTFSRKRVGIECYQGIFASMFPEGPVKSQESRKVGSVGNQACPYCRLSGPGANAGRRRLWVPLLESTTREESGFMEVDVAAVDCPKKRVTRAVLLLPVSVRPSDGSIRETAINDPNTHRACTNQIDEHSMFSLCRSFSSCSPLCLVENRGIINTTASSLP